MKRKLLGLTLLYVLGVAILQKGGFSVFGLDFPAESVLPEQFSGEIIAEVIGYSPSTSGYLLRVSATNISYDDVQIEADIDLQCYVKAQPEYLIGDIVSVNGTFSVPQVSTNPGQFNTYIYNKSRGIDFISYEPEISIRCSISERDGISRLHRGMCAIKQTLLTFRGALTGVLTELTDEEAAGIFRAILLGDRSRLSEKLSRLYQVNGISHILAISGLHIGLVSGMLYGLLRLCGVSYLCSGIVGIFVTFSYGYMTGAADASMRAAIMLAVAMVGAMLGRTNDLLTAMGISAAILVSCSVYKLYDGGFILSYGAILGIGYVYPCLERGLRLKHKWSKTFGVTLAIQLVILPVMLHFYGTVAPYSVLLNLMVIPMMTPVLALGVIAVMLGFMGAGISGINLTPICSMVLSGLSDGLSGLAGKMLSIAYYIIHGITWMCQQVIKLPLASVILGAMDTRQMIFYYGALTAACFLLYYRSRKRRHKEEWNKKSGLPENGKRQKILIFCTAFAGMILVMAVQLVYRHPKDMLTMLDVGQGDGILLQTRSGLHILVDGGSTSVTDVGKYVLEPALKYYGIRTLDYVIVTHGDTDHINGILYLLEQSDALGTKIETVLIPKCCKMLEEYAGLTELALSHGVKVDYLEPGMALTAGTFTMTCLSPKANADNTDINDLSTVLSVSYGRSKLLLTGDISMEVEEHLYQYHSQLTDLDILKVAHHGSKYSTSEKFLGVTAPKLALISCGENNRYGHPHKELIERLERAGCSIMSTPHLGAIEIQFYDNGWDVAGWRGDIAFE